MADLQLSREELLKDITERYIKLRDGGVESQEIMRLLGYGCVVDGSFRLGHSDIIGGTFRISGRKRQEFLELYGCGGTSELDSLANYAEALKKADANIQALLGTL